MRAKRAVTPGLAVAIGLTLNCCGADSDTAFQHVCAAEDGRGKTYEASNFEMLDAIEDAMQRCEMAALDPTTCVARGCRAGE